MLIDSLRPTTLVGVKRLAKQLKKERGIKHSNALDLAAKSADCLNFRHAQRTLPASGFTNSELYVLLTIYWSDKEQGHRCGRETLRIELSMPILHLCSKSALKYVRGFGNLRMVAEVRIPRACGHRFHEHVATCSTVMWPPIPRHVATLLR